MTVLAVVAVPALALAVLLVAALLPPRRPTTNPKRNAP